MAIPDTAIKIWAMLGRAKAVLHCLDEDDEPIEHLVAQTRVAVLEEVYNTVYLASLQMAEEEEQGAK